MQLNEEQTAAVEHEIGAPACLIAGAGSGKTRVLTERVRWLIKQGIPPRRICAITFTNKASKELINRLGYGPEVPKDQLPRVSTIHSLALNAIRKNPEGFGLQSRVSTLDEGDAASMIKKIIDRMESDENQWAMCEIISFHRQRGLCFSAEYTAELHRIAQREHGGYHAMDTGRVSIWKAYEEEKKANSVVDFDDMLHLVVHRAKTDEKWRSKLERSFEFVLMDEAQDTNPVQWAFVNFLLHPENFNLYVVGDMSQSIYGFNGATPELLLEYSEGWRGTVPKLYRIARNHRSVPEIVQLANATQAKMTNTIPLRMESWRGLQGEHGTTKLMKACEPRDIAIQIASEIHHDSMLKRNPLKYDEVAILVRSGKTQVRDIEAELVKRRIPYVVRGGQSLLQTEEIRDLMCYMRLVSNPNDFMALNRAVSIPKRGIGPQSLERIRDVAKTKYGNDLIAACQEEKKLAGFVLTVNQIRQCENDPLAALREVIRLTDYAVYVKEKYRREPERVQHKLENLDRIQMLLQILLEDNPMTISDVCFQLTMDRGAGDGKDEGKVVISTIHCSPPDELVLTTKGNKPIALLQPGVDKLLSYTPKCNQLLRSTRPNYVARTPGYDFSIKSRSYKGDLVVIDTPESHTRVTPEHRVRVAFNENFYDKWVVYLMKRGDWWRIGMTRSMTRPYKSGGVPGRLAGELGESAWILGVFETRDEAVLEEIRYQVTYGIPPTIFEPIYHKSTTPEEKQRQDRYYQFHQSLATEVAPRALKLLKDRGLLADAPLYRRKGTNGFVHKIHNGSYFDTVAANLIDGHMQVLVANPTDYAVVAGNRPRPQPASICREFYEGLVFSLDVLPHHFYISGGMVVHNSAKGLEWRRVYMTNCYEGSLPHKFSMGSLNEIEEERRLFYVGNTRARDELILCVPAMQQMGPNTHSLTPSRFLAEIGIK